MSVEAEIAGLRALCAELLHVSAYECDGCARTTSAPCRPPYPRCGASCQLVMEARRLGVEVDG